MNVRTADGFVSAYGFACGHVQRFESQNVRVELWAEHDTYHVRGHDFNGHGRLFWDSFHLLGEARKRFRNATYAILLSQTLKD